MSTVPDASARARSASLTQKVREKTGVDDWKFESYVPADGKVTFTREDFMVEVLEVEYTGGGTAKRISGLPANTPTVRRGPACRRLRRGQPWSGHDSVRPAPARAPAFRAVTRRAAVPRGRRGRARREAVGCDRPRPHRRRLRPRTAQDVRRQQARHEAHGGCRDRRGPDRVADPSQPEEPDLPVRTGGAADLPVGRPVSAARPRDPAGRTR